MILLIGSQDDPHLMTIQEKLSKENNKVGILVTDREALINTEFTFLSNNRCVIKQNENIFNTQDVKTAFCLAPMYQRDYQKQISKTENYWFFTWRESLYGFYAILSEKRCFINHSVYNAIAAQSKIKLDFFARKANIKVPNYLISNDKIEIKGFFSKYKAVVIKTLHQVNLWIGDDPAMLLVQRVCAQDFDTFDSVGEAPLFLQQAINKSYDLRAIIIGDEMIFCKIDASQSDIGWQDWRAYDLPKTRHEVVDVDKRIKEKLQNLMRYYLLDYACIDLCVDETNQLWILDVNPFGRFLWIEKLLNIDISNRIANFLSNRF